MMENLPFREPPQPTQNQELLMKSIPDQDDLEDDGEWEYEYSETETEVCFLGNVCSGSI